MKIAHGVEGVSVLDNPGEIDVQSLLGLKRIYHTEKLGITTDPTSFNKPSDFYLRENLCSV
jgi:hypothetical protein